MFFRCLSAVWATLRLVSVEPYLCLCLFGYTVRLVTFQGLLTDAACRNMHLFGDDVCSNLDDHKTQRAASIEAGNNLYSGVMLLSSLPAAGVALFLGPWSDRHGRKFPMLLAAVGMALEAAASATIAGFFPDASPMWYVATSVFAGLSGGFIMCASTAFSYMSDVTEERSRPSRYAMLEFSSMTAVLLGNVIGARLYSLGGYTPAMIAAPCSFLLATLYSAFCVKETIRSPEEDCRAKARDLLTIRNIRESWQTCSMRRPGNIRLQIWLMVWVACSVRFVDMGTLAVSYPYTRTMYDWDVADFSDASSIFSVVNALVTVAVIPALSQRLRLHEAVLGLVGILSLVSKMLLTASAVSVPIYYYAWISGSLNNAASIAVRSRLSKLVNKDELGRAFSLLATCESVTPLLGTLSFVQLYNSSLAFFPGMPFALAVLFLLPCICIFTWMIRLPTISVGSFGRPLTTVSLEGEITKKEERTDSRHPFATEEL